MIVYTEPTPHGDVQEIRITEADAILRMKEYARQRGYLYESDQDALEDFLVVHWASQE